MDETQCRSSYVFRRFQLDFGDQGAGNERQDGGTHDFLKSCFGLGVLLGPKILKESIFFIDFAEILSPTHNLHFDAQDLPES